MCATLGCVRPYGHNPPCIDGNMETIQCNMKVEVVNFAGCRFDVSVEQDSDVASLKLLLHDRWQVPLTYQTLLVVGNVLNDSDLLKLHCSPHSSELTITMLLSLEGLQTDLKSHDCTTREQALDFLVRHGSKGHDHSVDEVISLFEQTSRRVIFFCARVLVAFATRGRSQLDELKENVVIVEEKCGAARNPQLADVKDLIMQAQSAETLAVVMASVLDGRLSLLDTSLIELLSQCLWNSKIFNGTLLQEAVKALANVILDQLHMPLTDVECLSRRCSLRRASAKDSAS